MSGSILFTPQIVRNLIRIEMDRTFETYVSDMREARETELTMREVDSENMCQITFEIQNHGMLLFFLKMFAMFVN